MNKYILILIAGIFILAVFYVVYNLNIKTDKKMGGNFEMQNEVYQGPVRPTDNEDHFRKTGETISLENIE